MKKKLPPGDDTLVSFFLQHVVPIYFSFKKGDRRSCCLVTSFVMSVHNQWFLMTAGHCIKDIEQNLRAGYAIERCRLIDSVGIGARHSSPIPFDYLAANPISLCYDETYDYGIIFVDELTKQLLKANGVVALTEEVWEKQPSHVDQYLLLGIPAELSEADADYARVTSTLHHIIELPQRPEGFKDTDAPTFWGEIQLRGEIPMTDIEGMSGGPVFAVMRGNDGRVRYWVHAIQSRWIKSKRQIAACLIRPLGVFLKGFMERQYHQMADQESAEQM